MYAILFGRYVSSVFGGVACVVRRRVVCLRAEGRRFVVVDMEQMGQLRAGPAVRAQGRSSFRTLRVQSSCRWKRGIVVFFTFVFGLCTRPSSARGCFFTWSTDRIRVDVEIADWMAFWSPQISVVATTFLPEAKRGDSGSLPDRQPAKQRTLLFDQQLLDSIRKRPLDGIQQCRDS